MKKIFLILSTLAVALFALSASAQQPQAPAAAEDTTTTAPQTATQRVATHNESLSALWDAANTAYINSDFTKAIGIYRQILDSGMSSAKLYYNIANAYFKTGNTAQAILFYHRALRLSPGDDDIRYNLEVAESRTKDKIDVVPEFFMKTWVRSVRNMMGCTAWSILSLIALVAMLSLFLVYMLSQRLSVRKVGFYGTIASLIILACTFSFAASERSDMLNRQGAIIMVQSLAVKSSPDNSATDLFVLHEGTKVEVTNALDGWCEITIADGKKGWVICSKIEKI